MIEIGPNLLVFLLFLVIAIVFFFTLVLMSED